MNRLKIRISWIASFASSIVGRLQDIGRELKKRSTSPAHPFRRVRSCQPLYISLPAPQGHVSLEIPAEQKPISPSSIFLHIAARGMSRRRLKELSSGSRIAPAHSLPPRDLPRNVDSRDYPYNTFPRCKISRINGSFLFFATCISCGVCTNTSTGKGRGRINRDTATCRSAGP